MQLTGTMMRSDWLAYKNGLKAAKTVGKLILIVFYTDWCPQSCKCDEVFRTRCVIEQTKKFVMVRVNIDKNHSQTLSTKLSPNIKAALAFVVPVKHDIIQAETNFEVLAEKSDLYL